jgi:hypothetical protein
MIMADIPNNTIPKSLNFLKKERIVFIGKGKTGEGSYQEKLPLLQPKYS